LVSLLTSLQPSGSMVVRVHEVHRHAAPLNGGRTRNLHGGRETRQMAHVTTRQPPVKSRSAAPMGIDALLG
jgi:hypothetical protein